MSRRMNTETNRSFWHKDGSLIGFICVHLLSGRRGTHPSDPSLCAHPHLRRPPIIPTPQYFIVLQYYHDNCDNGRARDNRVCGAPGQLKYLWDCWVEKTNNSECLCSGSSCITMCAIFVQRKVWQLSLFSKHYILKKVISHQWNSYGDQISLRSTSPCKPMICMKRSRCLWA